MTVAASIFEAAERRLKAWMEWRGLETGGHGDEAQRTQPSPGPSPIGAATAIHDEPTGEDQLGRATLAESLAAMFAAEQQATPFTLALLGDWGSGKSSVMEIAIQTLNDWRADKDYHEHARYDFRLARFNAWQYECIVRSSLES